MSRLDRRCLTVAALALVCLLAGCGALSAGDDSVDSAGGPYDVTVVEVVDGDTVDVRFGNRTVERVRLLGVDTTEVHVEVDPAEYEGVPDTEAGRQCLRAAGEDASDAVRERIGGERLTLELDPLSDTRGGYGRLLGYLYVEEENVNEWLLRTGHARLYDSEFTQRDAFADAEAGAREDGRGLWRCRTP